MQCKISVDTITQSIICNTDNIKVLFYRHPLELYTFLPYHRIQLGTYKHLSILITDPRQLQSP